ncbi:MAG: NUDIX hydrolase [Candidatus Margulisbacteria bacterium]|nr:NUDIX hydrolase [Candidatus Margulisiibacteriota bacterium]
MKLKEKLIKSEKIYSGKILDLKLDTVELPNGKTTLRENVIHKQAVAVLPIQHNGKVILIKQYRHCTGEELWEIPAGSIDQEENIEKALQRELSEEIGFIAKKVHKLCAAYTTPGFTSEFTHFFVAEKLISKKIKGDDDEFIEAKEYTIEEIFKMIKNNKIKDAKTILAVSLYKLTKV